MSARPQQPEILPYARAERQRTQLLKVVRAGFLIAFFTVTLLAVLAATDDYNLERLNIGPVAVLSSWWLTTVIALLFAAMAVAADRLTPNKKISTLSAIFFGLVVAMLASFALGSIIDLMVELWDIRTASGETPDMIETIKVLMGIGLGYICIVTVLQTQDDFRLVIPYVEFAKQLRGHRPLLLDSSTLIDARITDIASVGILQATLIVPRFVVEELQLLSDQSDATKRARGRRGLQTVSDLQSNAMLDVVIDETALTAKGVDQMLVDLAGRTGAIIATTDAGLASVAEINGIRVFSVHELARACRPVTLEGEGFRIKLVKQGEQEGQAVGYLDDGTMVVVNNAAHAIGRSIEVMVQSTIPTAAGRMIFASPVDGAEQPEEAKASENTPAGPVAAEESELGPAAPARPASSESTGAAGAHPPAQPSQRKRSAVRRNPRR